MRRSYGLRKYVLTMVGFMLCLALLGGWIAWFLFWKTASAIALITRFYPPNVPTSVLAIAAVGFLAMCLIQALRSVVPVRSWFHRWKLHQWLRSDLADRSSKHGAHERLNEIIELTNAKESAAFFDMPIEQICGQLSAVAELVLSEPREHQELLAALAGWAGRKEAHSLLQADASITEGTRNKVGYAIQRNIDSLQIAVTTHWRRGIRLGAMIVSAAIAYGILSRAPAVPFPDVGRTPITSTGNMSRVPAASPVMGRLSAMSSLDIHSAPAPASPFEDPIGSPLDRVMTALAVGLVGGFLASVFRDLVAIVERLRRA